MAKIHLLPPEVAGKIAAGEVVERPFSVVKELVENSLDAGASRINVELQAGGKKLIRVEDDGCGMSREDALLAFSRHSTSKIQDEEDLSRIDTLGFRGEALASISAVSRLRLITSNGLKDRATRVDREGEALLGVEDAAFPRGTAVEVRDLFFNLPARLKFLRSDPSELGMAVKYLTALALAHHEISFTLRHGKREVFRWPGVSTLRDRIFQVHGAEMIERLMAVEHREAENRVHGYASRPPSGRRDSTHQFFFVNRRPVRDRVLLAALGQAFRGLMEKDLKAEAFLFLELPYSEVDVNVHPAKAEVRFKDQPSVFRLVMRGIEKAVLQGRGLKEVVPALPAGEASRFVRETDFPGYETGLPPAGLKKPPSRLFGEGEETEEHRGWNVLGQYLDTYIVATNEEGLLVIDQHNAHERVLFEKYKETAAKKEWPKKQVLLPILFELSPSQRLSLEENDPLLRETGFRVEGVGGRTYALKEFPDILAPEEALEIFLALLEEAGGEKAGEKLEKLLATLACRTAVKAGQPLSPEKMENLVEELSRLPNHALCPHGRPVVIKVERTQIEKGMKRSPGPSSSSLKG